ncbi:hypothetical protein CABS02_13046 [Colletotrichum abscissum]|uniref:Uncharacterized protein n=1 Tax=Colletotrichum abscissum TaxID=1671311 RepID=A0A9P9X3R3_9PEZI|nr:hypothetical protein CABS02_13046 [Colletotrichum abscissum]
MSRLHYRQTNNNLHHTSAAFLNVKISDPSSVIAISIQPAAPETWVEFGIIPQLAER